MSSFNSIVPIFRAPFLELAARGQHRAVMRELANHFSSYDPPSERRLLENWFDFFYSILLAQYPCEYVYKNSLTTRLYLSRHNLQKSVLIDEFRSGNSRADIVVMNDTSTVYEVKSKYDSMSRLECQMSDYRMVFDRIYVVTAREMVQEVLARVDVPVGVMELRDDGELKTLRDAQSNKSNTDPGAIFDCMRQSEFCAVIKEAFGSVPDIPNSFMYRTLRRQFLKLDPERSHDLMVKHIRTRGKSKTFVDLILAAPRSLKHACLTFCKSRSLAQNILKRLKEPFSA